MLRIEGAVRNPITLTIDDLRGQYQPHSVNITYANDDRTVNASYTGARLWDILVSAGAILNTEQSELMRVIARAADSFRCIVKWHEFDPAADNKLILVGYEQNGQPIQSKHGPLRLVVPGDPQGLRYLRNLATLTVLNNRIRDE
jgi:DMSO/TMAO reductase YedYZ molybdopterin-dependent catalytic subunit